MPEAAVYLAKAEALLSVAGATARRYSDPAGAATRVRRPITTAPDP
jgi:hypothetical protein